VNSNLKRSEHELSELNSMVTDITLEAQNISPYLSITIPQGPKKPPSPMRQKLIKGFSKAKAAVPSLPREQKEKISETHTESRSIVNTAGQGSGPKTDEDQSSQPKIPEAQPS
jgi:hypothetical protein